MLPGVVEVEMHLPGVSVRKLADFEINHHQASEAPMEEEEIDPIPLVSNTEATLATEEGEVPSQFQQEAFQVVDQTVLQIGLGILVL